ncbi:MAG TPA: hypothetical protein VIK86_09640 [Candidatus Paceibacterota bacterium]
MLDTQSSDTYTKSRAYNFLKGLLGVSKNVIINRNFFNLFFYEDENFYFIKKSEKAVKKLFKKEGIRELNNLYFQKKSENKIDEANEIAKNLLSTVSKSLKAA